MPKNPLADLPIRKQKYAILRANSDGLKTKAQCLLEAGYSESTASQPSSVETKDYKQAFQQLLRQRIPIAKAVRNIRQGMSAVNTEFFSKNGVVTDSRDTINWAERRQYTNMYAQMAGLWTPKAEMEHTQKVDSDTLRRLMDINDKLSLQTIPAEQLKELEASHVTIDAKTPEDYAAIDEANSVYDRIHASPKRKQ